MIKSHLWYNLLLLDDYDGHIEYYSSYYKTLIDKYYINEDINVFNDEINNFLNINQKEMENAIPFVNYKYQITDFSRIIDTIKMLINFVKK